MSPGLAKLATVTFLVINCILWSQSAHIVDSSSLSGLLRKRSELDSSEECAPLAYPVDQQCAHVREACPETVTFLSLPHLQGYFCASPAARPAVFIGLLAWLALLFSTLGISASDFFCPNLATIAAVLGLDENVAGVTFLAFGNGSPDVFSTFSAMKAQSGSLAIGELLGAASFIVSVVVGSMCIIKPFYVNRGPFLRDVGFFTVAIALLLFILHDQEIHAWEAATLVGLYIIYVCTVVVGTWWEGRRKTKRRREQAIRAEYEEDTSQPYYFEPYQDDVSPTSSLTLAIPPTSRARALSNPHPPRSTPPQLPRRPHARSPNLSPPRSPGGSPSMPHLPSFSLVTALEFRDVVASLRHQTGSSSLAAFESPVTPLGRRPHQRSLPLPTRATPATPATQLNQDGEVDPWDTTLGRQMHLSTLSADSPDIVHHSPPSDARTPIPVISVNSPSSQTSSVDEGRNIPPTRWERILHVFKHTYHISFPHLNGFSNKSIINILVAIFATPAVLVLTITLPVVSTPYGETQQPRISQPDEASEGRLIDFEEDGVERVLVAEDELKAELYEEQFNKWLTAVQCALAPLFCVAMVIGRDKSVLWYLIGAAVIGVSTGALVLVFADRGNDPAARLARCFMGFIVAVVWIMAIADEVVSVLKTFGLIFGLSDAIIGLTVFAVGNSLADLVANMSVAAFAPIMGFSACFGGPMLNILLGVGVSGSYIIQKTGHNFELHFSTTLLVSTVGLLSLLMATMIFVPWNGYLLSRGWGVFLIASYLIVMVVNIIVEVGKL